MDCKHLPISGAERGVNGRGVDCSVFLASMFLSTPSSVLLKYSSINSRCVMVLSNYCGLIRYQGWGGKLASVFQSELTCSFPGEVAWQALSSSVREIL